MSCDDSAGPAETKGDMNQFRFMKIQYTTSAGFQNISNVSAVVSPSSVLDYR